MQESYVNNPCLFVIFYFINFITEAFSLKQIKIYLIKQEFAIYVLIDTFVTMLCIKAYPGHKGWMYHSSCKCMIHLNKQDHQHNPQLRRTKTPKASLWTSKVSTWYHKRYLGISYVKINKKKIGLIICYRNKRKYVRQIKDFGTKLVTYCVCSHTFSSYAQSLCCLFCKHMQILCIQDPQSTACHVHTKNCIVFLQNVWISKWVTSTLTKIRSNFFVLIHGNDIIVFTYFWQTHLRIKTIKILFLHPSWPSK